MPSRAKHIYVEIEIRGPMDRVWLLTQTPELHRRWDLRFTEIRYLPRLDDSQPQRFLYATRIGFGLNICGEGETIGSRNTPTGERISALKFWSEDSKSLIRKGSGYWKYIPTEENGQPIRFLTMYDYDVRFGIVGRLFDTLFFRHLMGWATAWSFDRLRLWIEKDVAPVESMRHSLIYLTARLSVALVWIYQGLVPKLIYRNPSELAMLHALGLSDLAARASCTGIGCIEVAIGLTLLVLWRSAAPLWLTLVAMPVALIAVAIKSSAYLCSPFNPVSLNLSVFALTAIALLINRDLPSANHCLRRPLRGNA
jgi:DoxX-like family